MFYMQFSRRKSPDGHKRLQEVDRHQGKCLGIHIVFENAFGHIAKQNEDIDENDGEECAYHRQIITNLWLVPQGIVFFQQ